jgi:hypothetical protein
MELVIAEKHHQVVPVIAPLHLVYLFLIQELGGIAIMNVKATERPVKL